MNVYIKENNDTINIRFEYNKQLISKVKKFKKYSWNKTEKMWQIPNDKNSKELIYKVFKNENIINLDNQRTKVFLISLYKN